MKSEKPLEPSHSFLRFPRSALEQTLTARFEQQVALYPTRVAVQDRQVSLTYEALNHRANALALELLDVTDLDTRAAALLLDQGAPVVVGLLGALKAGKPFVVLDPTLPPARLAFMLQDAQAQALVTAVAHAALGRSLASDRIRTVALEAVGPRGDVDNPDLSVRTDSLGLSVHLRLHGTTEGGHAYTPHAPARGDAA